MWILVAIVVFVCVFLLIGRVYVAKDKKYDKAAEVSDVETGNGADSDSGE